MGNQVQKQQADLYLHPCLGQVRLFNETNKEKETITLFECTRSLSSQNEYDNWTKTLQRIVNSEIKQVVLLPIKHWYLKEGMCGSVGSVKMIFEDFMFVLNNQIKNRNQLRKPFLETELWYLLYNLVKAAKQFERQDMKIGDVKPSNIVINEDGHIRVISTITFPNSKNNYEKIIENKDQIAYLAPEQCVESSIRKGEYPYKVRRANAQAFSVGLTILQAATLEDCSKLYVKIPEIRFEYEKLKSISSKLNGFSEAFVTVIRRLLQIKQTLRPTCKQIHTMLFPFEQFILNLDQFDTKKILTPNSQRQDSRIISRNTVEGLKYSEKNAVQYFNGYGQTENKSNLPIQYYQSVIPQQTMLVNFPTSHNSIRQPMTIQSPTNRFSNVMTRNSNPVQYFPRQGM